jgi:very-short-patch-repair endonuclease
MLLSHTQSPIEALFAVALSTLPLHWVMGCGNLDHLAHPGVAGEPGACLMTGHRGPCPRCVPFVLSRLLTVEPGDRATDLICRSQIPVGPYRLDFVLSLGGATPAQLAVECDGWQYHRHADRFHADRKRDRYMLARGIPTIRFTGREINSNPAGCARDAVMLLLGPSDPRVAVLSMLQPRDLRAMSYRARRVGGSDRQQGTLFGG